MSEYKLKTGNIDRKVTDLYNRIEQGVVSSYQAVEDTAVGLYKKVEDRFVDTFLDSIESDDKSGLPKSDREA